MKRKPPSLTMRVHWLEQEIEMLREEVARMKPELPRIIVTRLDSGEVEVAETDYVVKDEVVPAYRRKGPKHRKSGPVSGFNAK